MSQYQLLDSGHRQKLERFGEVVLLRPSPQAIWRPMRSALWEKADATFSREDKRGWVYKKPLSRTWTVVLQGIVFKVELSNFGHVGLFPEHAPIWKIIQDYLYQRKSVCKVLNLFAYSGGATLAAAKTGAEVTHLDASKKSVQLAKENALLNKLQDRPIRWIVDDVKKFLSREVRRLATYDAIVMDPPSFGRGAAGEVFKIEDDLDFLMETAKKLLKRDSLFLFSTHTPGFTPLVLKQLFASYFPTGKIETGDLFLGEEGFSIPSGSYASWYG